MTENDAIAMVLVFGSMGAVAIFMLYFRYAARKMRSAEIIKALELGKDVPLERAKRRSFLSDLRTGVLLLTFSIGFSLFLYIIGAHEGVAMALIPLFLGLGFLINSALVRRYESDNGSDSAATPQLPREDG